jgi:Mg-chelatase subunit ChlD
MKSVFSFPVLLCAFGALVACSASEGPVGEAVGNDDSGGSSGNGNGNGGTSNGGTIPGSGGSVPTSGGTAGTISVSGTGGTAGNECGVQTFNLERKPAEVLLVLDRSNSMEDPPDNYIRPDGTPETAKKWDLIIPALLRVVEETNTMVSWGLKVFPEGEFAGACVAGTVTPTIDVEIAENNAQAVMDRINATNNHGDGTPTGDAIQRAVDYLESRASVNDYNRFILLATDGEPSCINVTETSGPGDDDQATARPYAIDAIATAAVAKFNTFVVGVGTNKESAKDTLNAMALAGGETANCANPLDSCFFLGNSQDQLVGALRSIATVVSTCVFPLDAMAPDPNNVRVMLSGEKIERDSTRQNGWEYQDAAQTIVEVYGPACDNIKQTSAADVAIRFGCPDVDVR